MTEQLVRGAHLSMQFSDSTPQMRSDCAQLLDHAVKREHMWITGTEAGGEKSKPLPGLLAAAAAEHGYHFHIWRGDWIMVADSFVDGALHRDAVPVLESTDGEGAHTDRGVVWVRFANKELGTFTIATAHYLTRGRPSGVPAHRVNLDENRRLAQAIGALARREGAGSKLFIYQGDQNISDRVDDTFLGAPLTSAGDELGKWPNTGHGPIDVAASYNGDGRVRAHDLRVLDDRELHFHTDHFHVETTWAITPLRGRRR